MKENDRSQDTKVFLGGRALCSPMFRCFPPQPTICLICQGTTTEFCLLVEKLERADDRE